MRKVALLNHSRQRRAAAAYHKIGIGSQPPLVGKFLHARPKLKQHAVTAERQLAVALTQMCDHDGVVERDVHPAGRLENRIASRFADLAHVEAGKRTSRETV